MHVHVFIGNDGWCSGWGTNKEMNEHVIGYTFEEDADFFKHPFDYRLNEHGELVVDLSKRLAEVKAMKIAKLKDECSARILKGFEYNGHNFGFSTSDQSNITSTMMAFQMGMLQEVEWTTLDKDEDGNTIRVTLTMDEFKALCVVALNYKDSCIKRLRDVLEPYINACETIEDVLKVKWNMEV